MLASLFLGIAAQLSLVVAACPDYSDYSQQVHQPLSSGRYNLSYMRPAPTCRTFVIPEVDQLIQDYQKKISDPDMYRLFLNSFPNSLDTAIKWKGTAAGSDEELTFVITGDIDAMWLRDSANQMQSYLSLLKPSSNSTSLASLYRGVINLQSRYLLTSPFCNSFQAPAESGIAPATNGAATNDVVTPPYDSSKVFECKYELDSLAAFLEISTNYWTATKDTAFFGKYNWLNAVRAVMNTATSMQISTYASNGTVNPSPYTFQRPNPSSEETLDNSGRGNPVGAGTGLVRSAFRPSDDACIFQLFIPANMMFSRYLNSTAQIVSALGTDPALASQMSALSTTIRQGIEKHGIVTTPQGQKVYAYEIDGFSSANIMDDSNIPSLLAAPVYGYTSTSDPVYQSTRSLVLSAQQNPYYMHGPVISAVGGPHEGPGQAWPMASIVRILTSNDDNEITEQLKELVSSTSGLGLIHESINTFQASHWTRQWFSWANGLFGQMIVDLEGRKPGILKQSFQ